MVGRIIGRGGAVIKQLRVQSGADIRIDELCDRDTARGGRTLTIRGILSHVIRAEMLVKDKLGETVSSRQRAGAATYDSAHGSARPTAASGGRGNGREWFDDRGHNPDDGGDSDDECLYGDAGDAGGGYGGLTDADGPQPENS